MASVAGDDEETGSEKRRANLRMKTPRKKISVPRASEGKSRATHERAGLGVFGKRPRPVYTTDIRF
jgi:hypothetical protein